MQENIPIDPETGRIDESKLTDEQKQILKLAPEITKRLKEISSQAAETLRPIMEWLKPLQELYSELERLEPYLKTELEKEGLTLDGILEAHTALELLELRNDPESAFYKAMETAKAEKAARDALSEKQQAGRDKRREAKNTAAETGAIMDLAGGFLPVFSQDILWDVFSPRRISKIGTLSRDEIDTRTGQVLKTNFEDGEITNVAAADISYKALMLLSAFMANSVDDYREKFVADGAITFYVKGVLDRLEVDPRIRDDGQLTLDRKTAGMLYLENEFNPLLEYVGQMPNGSRYTVLTYEKYDAEADTMTVRTPYLYALWRSTQADYFGRQRNIALRMEENKKPLKRDMTPLEVNSLFKGSAYKENDAVLEIAHYITNILWRAGKSTEPKTTEINYRTLIKHCPRLKETLDAIAARPAAEPINDGKMRKHPRNNSALYNSELRKIGRAVSLIMNPDKSDALNYFEFISISPAKEVNGKAEFIPPTKSTIDGKMTIVWRRID